MTGGRYAARGDYHRRVAAARPKGGATWVAALASAASLAGGWLVVSPFILEYSGDLGALLTGLIAGSAVSVVSGVATVLRPNHA